jgi:hypothetical protein
MEFKNQHLPNFDTVSPVCSDSNTTFVRILHQLLRIYGRNWHLDNAVPTRILVPPMTAIASTELIAEVEHVVKAGPPERIAEQSLRSGTSIAEKSR